MEASHNNHRPHIQWEKMQCNVYNALTCDSGTSGLFLAASHSTCFVRFRDIPSSSGMWLWSVERRTVGGSVKSVCARPGQPGDGTPPMLLGRVPPIFPQRVSSQKKVCTSPRFN